MVSWDTIYKYLNFETSFEETGLSLDDLSSAMPLPEHDVLSLGIYIKGFNKILNGEMRFPAFKIWSKVACSSLSNRIYNECNALIELYEDWKRFNEYASRQNAQKNIMLERIRLLKECIIDNRDCIIGGLEEYIDVVNTFEKKKERSIDEIEKYLSALNSLADKGDFEARNHIGTLYYSGRIVEQDYRKAKELYTQASEEGSSQALINLGYIHYYARCGGEPNYEEAYKCFLKASKIGIRDEITEALYKLSDMYDKGLYVRRQRTKAFDIVKRLYENEMNKLENQCPDSQYIADLAIRLGRAYSSDGIHYDPCLSLHYYTQALYFLEERFDGEWFGDKKLIETCKDNIADLRTLIYGTHFDGNTITPLQLARELNESENSFIFQDLIYDDERKELYLYLSSFGYRTIAHLGLTYYDMRMCVVIPSKRVTLNLENIEKYKYGHGIVRLYPLKINEKSLIHSWELVLSSFDDEDLQIARFSSKNEPGVYVGYIKDCDCDVAYMDGRFSNPKGFDTRYIMKFGLDWSCELMWPVNENAKEKFGNPVDIGSLGLSDGLKDDIDCMLKEYVEYLFCSDDAPDLDDERERAKFREEVEMPIFNRLVRELGEDYVIEFLGSSVE